MSQESLSTALENLKAGTVATFNYLSVLIAYAGYKFFKVILLKRQLLGKTTLEQEIWLNSVPANQKLNVTMSRQELLGITLILGFNAVIMLSIINDDQAYLPPTTKNKEKFLRENSAHSQRICKECREMERSIKSEQSSKYDERLSQKYGQRILRADLDMRGSIGQFRRDSHGGTEKTTSFLNCGHNNNNSFNNHESVPEMLAQDEEHVHLLKKMK